jgi:hypothetical protein
MMHDQDMQNREYFTTQARTQPLPVLPNIAKDPRNPEQFCQIQQLSQQQQLEVHMLDDSNHKRQRSLSSTVDTSVTPVGPNFVQSQDITQQHTNGKRPRRNTYRAPREVMRTLTSTIGSLVGGTLLQTNNSVRFRRELSSSQLDQFICFGEQKMDEEHSQSRERAMSF